MHRGGWIVGVGIAGVAAVFLIRGWIGDGMESLGSTSSPSRPEGVVSENTELPTSEIDGARSDLGASEATGARSKPEVELRGSPPLAIGTGGFLAFNAKVLTVRHDGSPLPGARVHLVYQNGPRPTPGGPIRFGGRFMGPKPGGFGDAFSDELGVAYLRHTVDLGGELYHALVSGSADGTLSPAAAEVELPCDEEVEIRLVFEPTRQIDVRVEGVAEEDRARIQITYTKDGPIDGHTSRHGRIDPSDPSKPIRLENVPLRAGELSGIVSGRRGYLRVVSWVSEDATEATVRFERDPEWLPPAKVTLRFEPAPAEPSRVHSLVRHTLGTVSFRSGPVSLQKPWTEEIHEHGRFMVHVAPREGSGPVGLVVFETESGAEIDRIISLAPSASAHVSWEPGVGEEVPEGGRWEMDFLAELDGEFHRFRRIRPPSDWDPVEGLDVEGLPGGRTRVRLGRRGGENPLELEVVLVEGAVTPVRFLDE